MFTMFTSPAFEEVVLYQYDLADPMNPLGLLVAYAEAHVLPAPRAVRDFVEVESWSELVWLGFQRVWKSTPVSDSITQYH